MLYLQNDQEESSLIERAFDAFDDADKEYSEDPSPTTLQRRRLAMNRVSDLLLRDGEPDYEDPMLNHLANILIKIGAAEVAKPNEGYDKALFSHR